MASWYYAIGNEQRGPVEAAEVERLIDSGQINAETLVWRQGMSGWEAAAAHFASARPTGAPPPLTPGHPTQDSNIGPDGLYVGAPSREFVEAAKVCLSKYATFSGRASRSEFWFFYLFWNLVMIVAQFVDFAIIMAMVATGVPFFVPIFSVLAIFGMIVPQLAVSWRRLHDIDRTGWWLGGGMIVSVLFYAAMIGTIVAQEAAGNTGTEPPAAMLALIGVFFIGMLVYGITIFIFYVTKGTLGPNRFG